MNENRSNRRSNKRSNNFKNHKIQDKIYSIWIEEKDEPEDYKRLKQKNKKEGK